jgi:predicted RNase H-like nuclease (RuvC/YqgF family)
MHLTAAGVYDVFHWQWDIPVDNNNNWITSSYHATRAKAVTFNAFFNMKKIESLMDSNGLQFAWRLVFVNRWIVRIVGKPKPGKTFVKSNYEARKKAKHKVNITKSMPGSEMLMSDYSELERLAESQASKIKELTKFLKPLRKGISILELRRMDISREVRTSSLWDSDLYQNLKKIRQEIANKRLEIIKIEKELVEARSILYSMNKALWNNSTTTASTSVTTTVDMDTTNPSTKIKEDYIEFVSIYLNAAF